MPLLRDHMQLVIEREERPTSITGLSLVLFLFLSMISMMAAYEASKPSEDAQSGVVISFHEYTVQTADSETDYGGFLFDPDRLRLPAFIVVYIAVLCGVLTALATEKHFDARGPPMRAAAAI